MNELGRVRDEMLVLAVDGIHGKYGIFPDVGVSVLEARAACRNERFEEFGVFGDFLEETKRRTANIFIRMLL